MDPSNAVQHNLDFKIFVKELGENYVEPEPKSKHKFLPVVQLTGDKAKEIYEEIISQPPEKKRKIPIRKCNVKLTKSEIPPNFKQSDIFKFAQNNEVGNLKLLLSQPGININATDDYGWTALMCAACSGAKDSVALLLQKEADITISDKSNRTAISLARKNHHNKILTIIKDYKKLRKETERKKQIEPIFCEICKREFQMNPEKHECSTLHLFNSKPKKLKTFYGIPDSNRGFQLLLKEGWDRESGLGPEGSGRKFPVKAKMKKDRCGIGAPPRENPKRDQTRHNVKFENKRQIMSANCREKSFEKNFRLEFL